MPRTKTSTVRTKRHKKIIKVNKGYYGSRSKLFRRAQEAFIRAGEHAFAGRKLKKRDMKKLWIIRISAASKELGMNYSEFINKLNSSKIKLDRKVLADIALRYPETFKKIAKGLK